MTLPSPGLRYRGISWAPVLFLLAFLAAVGVIAYFLYEPMVRAANSADPEQRKRISAYAILLIFLLIIFLLVGLMLTLRVGRRIGALAEKPPKPTDYPDAWAESARRVKTPEPEELEEDEKG